MTQEEKIIIACIDGSKISHSVCHYASWIAKKRNRDLKILHTIEQRNDSPSDDLSGAIGLGSQDELLDELMRKERERRRKLISHGQTLLEEAKDQLKKAHPEGPDPQLEQRHGTLSESLIELEDSISTAVIGIRGETTDRRQQGIGTQLESIIRSIHRPILVVNQDFKEPKKSMLAFDGSESCRKALQMIATTEAFRSIPCHVVHVGSKAEAMLSEAKEVLEKAGVSVVTAELNGVIEDALAAYQESNGIDVTLMGAFSHNKIRGFLMGSFTAKMLEKTNKPLFLLR